MNKKIFVLASLMSVSGICFGSPYIQGVRLIFNKPERTEYSYIDHNNLEIHLIKLSLSHREFYEVTGVTGTQIYLKSFFESANGSYLRDRDSNAH